MNAVNIRLTRAVPIMLTMSLIAAQTSVASAQRDPRVGFWELNVAKSAFSPGPPPKKQTLWFQAKGRELVAMLWGIDAAGKPINPDAINLAIIFDGRDHPTPHVNYESSAWARINANKYVVYRKQDGKVVLTSTNVVSNDGKTMTITTTGVDEAGRWINNVRVYDKA